MNLNTIITGDSLEVLRSMADESVDMCVTSPPYYGLRNYGVDGQIGLEATPEEYVEKLVEIFHEVRRILKPDGTRNACSCLYAAAARRAEREGYKKIVTFILQSEPGTSLKAAGWTLEAAKAGKPRWNRQRYADRPIQLSLMPRKEPPAEYKQRWAKYLKPKNAQRQAAEERSTP